MTQKNRDIAGTNNQSSSLAISFDEIMQAVTAQKRIFKTTPDRLFGYILFLFRSELELNQEEMGKMLAGLSKSSYSKYENGIQSINISHIFLLSHVTNVTRSFIYELHEYLVALTIELEGWLNMTHQDETLVINDIESKPSPKAKKSKIELDEALNTPLKEYPIFFGAENVAKLTTVINQAIRKGGKLEPRKL